MMIIIMSFKAKMIGEYEIMILHFYVPVCNSLEHLVDF